jgi:hypothetical protein
MDKQNIKVYTASSVGIDYFFFLNKTIESAGYVVEPLYLISEVNYRKLAKGSGIKKIWLRTQMYLLYPLYIAYKGLRSSNKSIFIITSNTFYAPFLMKVVTQFKKGKVIHLLYDLFPDAMEVAGSIEVNSFKSKLIGLITKKNQKKCDSVVYLGGFLKKHAENRWGKAKESAIIDISADLSLYKSNFNKNLNNKKLIIHYGGQLGYLHDASSIIDVVKFIYSSDIAHLVEFNFYISGAHAQLIKTGLQDYPVKIISAVSSDQWRKDINNFDIGLVSLSPGGASVCLPSKTYGMMAGGMAIIGICPQWSDLATLIDTFNSGWIINNSLYEHDKDLHNIHYLKNIKEKRLNHDIAIEFYDTVKFILKNRNILNEKRQNAYYGIRNNFDIDNLGKKWAEIIK